MMEVKTFKMTICAVTMMAATGFGALEPTVAWDPSTTDIYGQALEGEVRYKLFVSDSATGESLVVDAGTATSASVEGLEYNKTYTFKAKAYTTDAESDYSEEIAWTSPLMTDEDEDGLSDSWEQEHFQTLNLSQSSSDFDRDGCSDEYEFIAGTDPVDSSDFPTVQILSAETGTDVVFQARKAEGSGYENRSRTYTLLQCDDLASGDWTEVAGMENIPASNQTVNVAVAPDADCVFYCTRIRLN